MSRAIGFLFLTMVGLALASTALLAQAQFTGRFAPARFRANGPSPIVAGPTIDSGGFSTPFVNTYFYPSYGGYGGYFSPFLYLPQLPPAYAYLPNHWWVSQYPLEDPRQLGYNPAAGYRWEDVSTLLLVTSPARTRVTLDGIFVGTTDSLGPFQLPVGEHSLRIEAAGYEPSETVLKVEQPVLQELDVRLKAATQTGKPGPRP